VRRIFLTLMLAIVMLAATVSPALAQVVVPSAEPCLYVGPVMAGIANFVSLTPCDVTVVSG
jgi:hypothetical protein